MLITLIWITNTSNQRYRSKYWNDYIYYLIWTRNKKRKEWKKPSHELMSFPFRNLTRPYVSNLIGFLVIIKRDKDIFLADVFPKNDTSFPADLHPDNVLRYFCIWPVLQESHYNPAKHKYVWISRSVDPAPGKLHLGTK